MQINIPNSKKLWMTIVGIAFVLFGDKLSLTPDQVMQAAGLLGVYVVGQGVADHGKEAEKIRQEKGGQTPE